MKNDLTTDILVCGAGPSGFAAAVCAARLGASVLLVEKYGFPGGMATAGLVNPFMVSKFESRDLVKGIFEEVIIALKEKNAAFDGELFGQPHVAFDPEVLKMLLLDMLEKASVKMLFHSFACASIMKGDEIKGAVINSKSGDIKIFAKAVIDATGDGDIAALSGCEFEKGRKSDSLVQPATLNFRVSGIDESKMPSREEMNELYLAAKKKNLIRTPRENLLWFETIRGGTLHFNSTRIPKIDGTDVFDLTKAEIEGRKQVENLYSFLRSTVPGFENSFISNVACQVGIRESRRIEGKYTLTGDDVTEGHKFEDAVARCNYPIDIHDPKTGASTVFKKLGPGIFYEVPFRCMVPQKIDKLLVTGRAISATHEALSSMRIMPTCMALGQAAGVACAMAVKKHISPRNLDTLELLRELNEQGANLRTGRDE
jgi:hypothetical protein